MYHPSDVKRKEEQQTLEQIILPENQGAFTILKAIAILLESDDPYGGLSTSSSTSSASPQLPIWVTVAQKRCYLEAKDQSLLTYAERRAYLSLQDYWIFTTGWDPWQQIQFKRLRDDKIHFPAALIVTAQVKDPPVTWRMVTQITPIGRKALELCQ